MINFYSPFCIKSLRSIYNYINMYYIKNEFCNLNNLIIIRTFYAKRRIKINHISLVYTNDDEIIGYALLHFCPLIKIKK